MAYAFFARKRGGQVKCLYRQTGKDNHCGSDADSLRELTASEEVYRYLPTFLFEKHSEDAAQTIRHMYDEGMKKSLILGVFTDGEFCGLAEIYGYRAPLLKASIGYRLSERFWGQGIATKIPALPEAYLFYETDVRMITASVMPENKASERVPEKNGFRCVMHEVLEYRGNHKVVKVDKGIKTEGDIMRPYTFHKSLPFSTTHDGSITHNE